MPKQNEVITISLVDAFTRGLTSLRSGVSDASSKFGELNAKIELAQKAFSAIRGASGIFTGAITEAASFEQALSNVLAVTKATPAEFEALKKAAVDASNTTKFTASEAALGLAELARTGLDATQSVQVLGPALNLAQAGAIGVSQASEILTQTLTQYGKEATEAAAVSDVLAKAADASATNIQEIGLASSITAPIARALGLTLEENTAILAALANEGFRGERAATALRNVYGQLLDPTSKFSTELDRLGISSRDFNVVLDELVKRGDSGKAALISLGLEPLPAILSLFGKGGQTVKDFNAILSESQGTAEATASTLGATFTNASAQLINSLNNARAAFVQPLLAPLSAEILELRDRVVLFTQSEQFALLSEKFKVFALDSIAAIEDLISRFNFDSALGNVQNFADSAILAIKGLNENLESIASAAKIAGDAMRFVGAGIDVTQAAVDNLGAGLLLVPEGIGRLGEAALGAGGKFSALADGSAELRTGLSELAGENLAQAISGLETIAGTGGEATDALNRTAESTRIAAGEFVKFSGQAPQIQAANQQIAKSFEEAIDPLSRLPTLVVDASTALATASANIKQLPGDLRNLTENAGEAGQAVGKLAVDFRGTEAAIKKLQAAANTALDEDDLAQYRRLNDEIKRLESTLVGVIPPLEAVPPELANIGQQAAAAGAQTEQGAAKIASAFKSPSIAIQELENRLTQLRTKLQVALNNGDIEGAKRIKQEIDTVNGSLNSLRGLLDTASASVTNLGNRSSQAAQQIASIEPAANSAAAGARNVAAASKTAESGLQAAGTAAKETGNLASQLSDRYLQLGTTLGQSGINPEPFFNKQLDALARYRADLNKQLSTTDQDVQASLSSIRSRFPAFNDQMLQSLAEIEANLRRKRRDAQQAIEGNPNNNAGFGNNANFGSSTGSSGGGFGNQRSQNPGFGINPPVREQRTVENQNFQISLNALDVKNVDEAQIEELGRRVYKVIRRLQAEAA